MHKTESALPLVGRAMTQRRAHRVALGASPRGALALLKLARAWAALRGRDFVTPDDVKAMAGSALAHRLILQPHYSLDAAGVERYVAEVGETLIGQV